MENEQGLIEQCYFKKLNIVEQVDMADKLTWTTERNYFKPLNGIALHPEHWNLQSDPAPCHQNIKTESIRKLSNLLIFIGQKPFTRIM